MKRCILMSLPIYPDLNSEVQDFIVEQLRNALVWNTYSA